MTKIQQANKRIYKAEQLLREYEKLTYNLNPDFPIEANSGKMMELITLCKQSSQFICEGMLYDK